MTIMMMTSFETTQGDGVLLGGPGGGEEEGGKEGLGESCWETALGESIRSVPSTSWLAV